jgi:CheY-like chemotaxis protein
MGKNALQRELVDLRQIASRCVEALEAVAREQRQTLALTTRVEALVVDGDVIRLEQVLSNLVTNALKYTAEGGRIDVVLQRVEGAAIIRVRDSGVGIEPEMLSTVFELFTQADHSLAHARGGLGLGLPVVKHLVELHGGAVTARSDGLGKGSEFTVRLPLAAASPLVAAVHERGPQALRGIRIVVVEDNPDLRSSLADMLRLEGHQVEEAAHGIEGANLIVARSPAVALVDIGLPGWNGFQVARFVRGRVGATVKLIALTGYGQPQDRQRALSAGFDAHLVKPITPQDLFCILAEQAERSA